MCTTGSSSLRACSRECWFRVHTYMDDFGCVAVDDPRGHRVQLARDAMAATGKEMNLPFGEEKWKAGAKAQVKVSLGIGFDTSDPHSTPPASCLTRADLTWCTP